VKQLTMKRIMGLKVLFDAVREKLGDVHLLNNSAQNNFQDMLETFESKLTSFKLSMKSEFDLMEENEVTLAREMMKVKADIDSWESSTSTQPSSPGGHNNISHSGSSDSNTQQVKRNLERQKKDVDRKAIIGTLDRKIAAIGRFGGWDPRDHDAFLKNWSQVMGPTMDSLMAEQLEALPQGQQQEETLSVAAAQRAALLKKLTVSVPGKSTGDLEDHLNWYLRWLYLTLLKKKVVSEWRKETALARSRQSEMAMQEGLAGDSEWEECEGPEDPTHPHSTAKSKEQEEEEERQAAKDKLARWKADKLRQQDCEKQEKMRLLEEEKRRAEEERRRRTAERVQLEEWRKAEQLAAELARGPGEGRRDRPDPAVTEAALQERQKRDLETARAKHGKVDSALQRGLDRERRVKEASEALRMTSKKDPVPRSKERLAAPTRASEGARLSPEHLDDAERRRRTAAAHSSAVALTGRDLRLGGTRAVPTWCKNMDR